MTNIWSIYAYSYKRRIYSIISITATWSLLMLPLKTTVSSGHCLSSWWLQRMTTCWSANTAFPNKSESLAPLISWLIAIEITWKHCGQCVAPWQKFPNNNWWLRGCRRKQSLHWWVGALHTKSGTSSKPQPKQAPEEGPLGLFHDRYSVCWCCQLFLQASICHVDGLSNML